MGDSKDDFNAVSENEIKIAQLEKIIELEYQKKDSEMNEDLVNECFDYIAELKGLSFDLSEEDKHEKLAQILVSAPATKKNGARRRTRLRTAIAAAMVALMLFACCVTAYAFSPTLRYWLLETVKLPIGGQLYDSENDITYIHNDTKAVYSSIEELASSEELDILYPTALPDGVKIKNIYSYGGESEIIYGIQFSSDVYSIGVYKLSHGNGGEAIKGDEININGVTYCIFNVESIYYAVCIYKDYYYSFKAPDRESLLYIIENVKGQ